MARQRGSKTQTNIYEQTVLDAVPGGTPTGYTLPTIDTDIALGQDLVESRVLRGDRNSMEPAPGEKGVAGGITIQPEVRGMGWILKHLFGGVATQIDVPSVGLNTHTFSVGDLPVGLTIEKWFPQVPAALQAFGCRINGMTIEVGTGGLLECRLDIMGVDEVDPAPTVRLDSTPLSYAIQGFRLPTVTLSEGGAGLTTATRFSMSFANNIEGLRTIGNVGRYADLAEGIFMATGTLAVLFDSMTLYNKAKAQTTSALIVTFPSVATPANQSMQYLFDEVKYSISSPGIAGPGGIIAELNWRAFVGTGTSTAKGKLVNDVTGYTAIP